MLVELKKDIIVPVLFIVDIYKMKHWINGKDS